MVQNSEEKAGKETEQSKAAKNNLYNLPPLEGHNGIS